MSAQPKASTPTPFMTMATNRDLCARTLARRKLPVENRISTGHFDPTSNKIKVMTMKVNKGLEVPVVAATRRGVYACTGGGREGSGAGVYVAATRAMQRLVLGGWGWGIWEAIAPCAITPLAPLASIIWSSETCPR